MKILGYDVNGGWDIDQYSPQQGHIIKFSISESKNKTKSRKIVWDLNGEIFEGETASHIFKKNGEPGQGYVTVKCKVYKDQEKKKKLKKKILIVPEINCQIQLEMQPRINNETKSIDLIAQPMCAWLRMGNDFNGNPNFACGGSCPKSEAPFSAGMPKKNFAKQSCDSCPEYEVLIGEVKGTHITNYGKHTLSAEQWIRSSQGANNSCVPLYKDNYLGLHSKYPLLTRTVCILPELQDLDIKLTDKKYLTIDGLSQYMLQCDAKITWNVNGDVYVTKKKYLKMRLSKGDYLVSVAISINGCEDVNISKIITST